MTKFPKSKDKDRPKRQPTGDYEVGYGQPPKHTQFKPGQSGNPAGRKKGINNFATDVRKSLNTPVEIVRDGKVRKVSSQEASLMRLREKALKGEDKGLDRYLELAKLFNNEALEKAVETLGLDADIVEVFVERVRSGAFGTPDNKASADVDRDQGGAP